MIGKGIGLGIVNGINNGLNTNKTATLNVAIDGYYTEVFNSWSDTKPIYGGWNNEKIAPVWKFNNIPLNNSSVVSSAILNINMDTVLGDTSELYFSLFAQYVANALNPAASNNPVAWGNNITDAETTPILLSGLGWKQLDLTQVLNELILIPGWKKGNSINIGGLGKDYPTATSYQFVDMTGYLELTYI